MMYLLKPEQLNDVYIFIETFSHFQTHQALQKVATYYILIVTQKTEDKMVH